MIRIRKVHLGNGEVLINYDKNIGENIWENMILRSPSKPSTEFVKSLQELDKDVIKINELKEVDLDLITVKGITLIYGKIPASMELMITSSKPVKLSNTPRNISSPKFEIGIIKDDDEEKDYKISLKERINNIIHYAENYIELARTMNKEVGLFDKKPENN